MSDKEVKTLKYVFNEPEMLELSQKLARKTKELTSFEEEKKSVTSQYKAKIDAAAATITNLSNLITDGWEFREVECTVEYHKPEEGLKTLTRTDTGETWTDRMESYEWDLFHQSQEEGEGSEEPEKSEESEEDSEAIMDVEFEGEDSTPVEEKGKNPNIIEEDLF